MPSRLCARFAAILLLFGLAACQTPLTDETGPLAVQSVAVTASPAIESQGDMTEPLRAAVSERLVGVEPGARPANVSISIDSLAYKNAAMSILVGSANSLSTTVTVTDASGATIASFAHKVVRDFALNGIVGAAIAIGQDRGEVDRRLIEAYADDLRTRIYGRPGHRSKKQASPAPPQSEGAPHPSGIPVS